MEVLVKQRQLELCSKAEDILQGEQLKKALLILPYAAHTEVAIVLVYPPSFEQ